MCVSLCLSSHLSLGTWVLSTTVKQCCCEHWGTSICLSPCFSTFGTYQGAEMLGRNGCSVFNLLTNHRTVSMVCHLASLCPDLPVCKSGLEHRSSSAVQQRGGHPHTHGRAVASPSFPRCQEPSSAPHSAFPLQSTGPRLGRGGRLFRAAGVSCLTC